VVLQITLTPKCANFATFGPLHIYVPSCETCTIKKRGDKGFGIYIYMNWFVEDKLPLIEASMKQRCSLSTMLQYYLKLAHMFLYQINFISCYDYICACQMQFHFFHCFICNSFFVVVSWYQIWAFFSFLSFV